MTLRRVFWLSVAAFAVAVGALFTALAAVDEEPELACAPDPVPVHGCTWAER